MDDEMLSFKENNARDVVDLPKGRKAIKTKWIFKTKRDNNGNILRHKVVRYSTIRLLVTLAVKKGLKIDQMDAITAFLQGDLNEEIYVELPEGFTDGSNKVGKLLAKI